MLGAEGVTVSQVGSADRAGGVILSGGEQRSVQILHFRVSQSKTKKYLIYNMKQRLFVSLCEQLQGN